MVTLSDQQRRRWLAGLGACALFVLIAGGIFWLQKSSQRMRPVLPPGASDTLREGFRPDALTSASCRGCHSELFTEWHSSHHALANRSVSAAQDRPAFEPAHTLSSGGLETQISWEAGRPKILAPMPGGGSQSFHPEMVLAYSPLRQFLIPFGSGRWQVTEWAWDPDRQDWFNVYGKEGRHPEEWGSWAGRGMNWNSNCAACHMTGYEKNYTIADDAYRSRWDEMGVSCLQCHAVTEEHLRTPSAPVPAMNPVRVQENCASCHSRRDEITPGFGPGKRFADHFRLALPNREGLYYPDGQVREEDFVYGSFLMSKMGVHGGLTCLDCHDPHSGVVKFSVQDNTSCLACHAAPGQRNAPVISPTAHSHHPEGSSGNRCIECHMPVTTYMQRDPRRDHSFGIPDPLLTRELGIPNACNACHTDQSADWAAEWTDTWYGEKMQRPERERSRAVAKAYGGASDEALMEELLRLANRERIPLWRATLLSLASRRVDLPKVRERLILGLIDPDPNVRAACIDGLAPLPPEARTAVDALQTDPVRLVRLRAAWATRESLADSSPLRQELLESLSFNADQPSGAALMGQWEFSQKNPDSAATWFRKAISWDPNSISLYADLALIQNASQQPEVSLATLNEGLRIVGDNPELLGMKALLLAELGDLDGAATAFSTSLRLQPNQARAWYNLGLLHNQQEQWAKAIAALLRSEEIDPESPSAPFARATIHLQQKDPEAARKAAQKALAIDPEFRPARLLLERIAP